VATADVSEQSHIIGDGPYRFWWRLGLASYVPHFLSSDSLLSGRFSTAASHEVELSLLFSRFAQRPAVPAR